MSTVEASRSEQQQRLILSGIAWQTYKAMSDLLGNRNVRLTYDRGELEIMTLSPEHERIKHLLVLLLSVIAEELDIDMAGFGSMTFRRDDLARGLEPDECYWIAHERDVRGRTQIDLENDPPPDLVVEVEITRNVIDRLPLYGLLGVPEVWRWDGQSLRTLLLQPSGQYSEAVASRALPFLPMAELSGFLAPDSAETETKLLRAFRAWVRQERASWKWP